MKDKQSYSSVVESMYNRKLFSLDIRPLSDDDLNSPLTFLKSYLTHHLNNKLTTIEGNLEYTRTMLEELDKIETKDEANQKKLDAIQKGLREALRPIDQAIDKIHSIRDEVNEFLGTMPTLS